MKRILFTIALSLTLTLSFAQGAIDALRFSTTTFNGDARYMGMSGAFGALGANSAHAHSTHKPHIVQSCCKLND